MEMIMEDYDCHINMNKWIHKYFKLIKNSLDSIGITHFIKCKAHFNNVIFLVQIVPINMNSWNHISHWKYNININNN